MLQSFSDRIRGSRWLGYTIVIAISIPFALWGVQAYFQGGDPQVAAQVNGEPIQEQQVSQQVSSRRQQLQQRFDGELPEAFTDSMLREQVLEQLITRELLHQHATEAGFRVTDERVATKIRQQQPFQRNGGFDRELYRQRLSQVGLSPEQYEQRVRRGDRIDQLRRGVTESAVVLGAEVREAARLSSEERRVAVLERKREAVASSVTIDDEAIRAFYEANKEQFKTARRVRVRYIELTRSDLVDQVEVPESEIRAEYEANQEQYKQAAERQASHILIEVPDDAGGDAQEKARKRAERLVKRIKNGADFAALAREHSDDPGSASNGGDLGYIGGGDMVAPFEQALFQMDEAGTVTGPVETKYGYHIIRLEHIREPEPKPFEAVREQIRQRLAQQRAERLLYDRVEVLKQEAYENPASLKPAAEAVGLEVQESDWLARDQGEGVASAEAVRQAAFSDSVLQEGRNSDVVEPGEQRAVVLRVAQERPPETKPLEAVRAEVRQQLETQRVQQALVDWSENAIERLRNGTDAETLADGEGVRLRNVGWMSRDGGDLGRRLTQTAFETPPPGSDGASYEDTDTSDGRVIVMVAERRFPEPGQDALDAARERLRRALSRAEGRTWIDALKSEADIVRHEQPANPNTGGGSG